MRQAGRAREWERIWLFEWVYCSERRREREGERERLGVKQKRRDGERGSEKDTKWMFPLYKCKGRRKKMWREESKGDSHSQSIWKKNRLIAVTSLIATFLSANRTVTVKPKPSGLHDQDRIVGCCFFNSSHCAAVAHRDRQDYKQVLHGVFPCNAEPWRLFLAIIASLSTNLSYFSGNCATAAAFVPKWQIFCWHGRVSFT